MIRTQISLDRDEYAAAKAEAKSLGIPVAEFVRRAIQFLAFIDVLPGLTIRGFDASGLTRTGRIVKKFSDQNLTLADAHGLALMRELRVGCCWSTDRRPGLDGVPLVL